MTVRQTTNGEILRLGYKDWLGLLALIVGGVVALYGRLEIIDRQCQARIDALRDSWSEAAPAPAKWTIDAVHRIDSEIGELRKMVGDITRLDTNQRAVMLQQREIVDKQNTMMEVLVENRTTLNLLREKLGLKE